MVPTDGFKESLPPHEEWLIAQRRAREKLSQVRRDRIRALVREIQIAKRKLREYDHLQAELRKLEREQKQEQDEKRKSVT